MLFCVRVCLLCEVPKQGESVSKRNWLCLSVWVGENLGEFGWAHMQTLDNPMILTGISPVVFEPVPAVLVTSNQ